MRSSECSLYSMKQIAEIRNIDIHDSDFYSMNYDDARRTLSFRCENLYAGKTFSFRFLDVLAYSMQSCSYYGRDTRLWEISAENYVLNGVSAGIQKHFTKEGRVASDEKTDCFRYLYPYFTVRFELASGDVLMISCKSMEVEKFGI